MACSAGNRDRAAELAPPQPCREQASIVRPEQTSFDVIVAGGGISGTLSALAAAREGARVLLVERYAALGGMATLGLVQPITTWGFRGSWVVGGSGRSLLQGMIDRSPASATELNHYGPTCDAEYLKRELEQAALDQGVSLLYHSWVTGLERDGDRIRALRTFGKSGEMRLSAEVFVDATGDGDLAVFAGLPVATDSQGITLMFTIAGIDRARVPDHDEFAEIYQRSGPIGYRGICVFWGPRADSCYVNMTEVEGLDGCDPFDLTHATVDCRRQAWGILDIFRAEVPGFEEAYIAQTAPALGVRESRHVQGLHVLTGEEALNGADFEDTIARAACPVDIHGSDDAGKGDYRALERSYGIPWRCLVTPGLANLIVTGRCISADHVAHSSVRRMAPGSALGEAAGIGAAQSLSHGDVRTLSVAPLQDRLRHFGAILDPE
jgi:hypothetical protein